MIIIITMITTMMMIIIITMITTMIIITIREPQYFIPTSSSFAPGSLPKRLLPTEDIFKVVVVTVMVTVMVMVIFMMMMMALMMNHPFYCESFLAINGDKYHVWLKKKRRTIIRKPSGNVKVDDLMIDNNQKENRKKNYKEALLNDR